MADLTSREPERDFVGYGRDPIDPKWPGGARIAVNFNLAYETGGELNVLDGDDASESLLTDIGWPSSRGKRSPLAESAFEYGSRVGIWRLLRIFEQFEVPASILAVATGLERNPDVARACVELGHEVVSHGYRWIDYLEVDEATEREHMRLATETLQAVAGVRPRGWMTGRPSMNTRRLLVEHGGYLYDRDVLNDELPYWVEVAGTPHLIVPYSYETNDNRCDQSTGFAQADDFFQYMRDAFDVLWEEGSERPALLSISMHDRLAGRPARAAGVIRLLDYMRSREGVWFCRGLDVAEHWRDVHPAAPAGAS